MRETFGSSLDWIEEPDGGRREGSGSADAGAQDAPAAPYHGTAASAPVGSPRVKVP